MTPSSRRARNGPLARSGTSLSSTLRVTGITPPTISRSTWLKVRLTSSATKIPDTWYSWRSRVVSALAMVVGWLAWRVSNFMALVSGALTGAGFYRVCRRRGNRCHFTDSQNDLFVLTGRGLAGVADDEVWLQRGHHGMRAAGGFGVQKLVGRLAPELAVRQSDGGQRGQEP